jgi:hypothetical protein
MIAESIRANIILDPTWKPTALMSPLDLHAQRVAEDALRDAAPGKKVFTARKEYVLPGGRTMVLDMTAVGDKMRIGSVLIADHNGCPLAWSRPGVPLAPAIRLCDSEGVRYDIDIVWRADQPVETQDGLLANAA